MPTLARKYVITCIHTQHFLDQTLATEKLSRLALEHSSRLKTKLTSLMKEYENHQMEMYIDMSPALKSFFHSSDGASSDNNSDKDPVPIAEDFYDVPNRESVTEFEEPVVEDQCDAPPIANPLPPAPETKKKGFMHRLLKTRSKASDLSLPFSMAAGKAQRIRPPIEDEDDKSRKESVDSEIMYDDAMTVKPPRAEEIDNDDASAIPQDSENSKHVYYNETGVKTTHEEDLTYDDAFRVIDTNEEYEYVANESISSVRELQSNNNDSDGVSMKSGVSDYGANAPSHRWHIAAADAKAQALRHGCMKRRNGRKLLSAWRHCYSVLLPAHLLMYANDGDSRPRIVIDLTEPNIKVKRVVKQGVDTRRLKTHPFVLLHEDRALYEMSTKSRDETDEWIMALQAILVQVGDSFELTTTKTSEDCDSDTDLPVDNKQKELQNRMDSIQGRNLPSLPAKEQENKPPQLQKTAKANNGSRMATLFRLRGKSSSSEEEPSSKRQSVDSFASAEDDVYQELPSPAASTTPYSSIENLKESSEDIYNSVQDVANLSAHDLPTSATPAVNPVRCVGIHHSRSLSDGLVTWPNAPAENLPVYDVPSPTIRPLSTLSTLSDEEGSNNMTVVSKRQKRSGIVYNQQSRKLSSFGSVNIVSDSPEVYDVPVTNPRRISIAEVESDALIAYDQVTTPPRTVVPAPEPSPPPSTTPATKKIVRYWQEKVGQADKQSSNFKKDNSPPTKCLPKPSSAEKVALPETKSVGRCFSRTTPQRAPLASLTELLASSKNGIQAPTTFSFQTNIANTNRNMTSSSGIKVGSKPENTSNSSFNPGIKASNTDCSSPNKKEKPPRPPVPVRTPLANKASEPVNLADELNRQLMKRVIKNGELIEQSSVESKIIKDKNMPSLKSGKDQYKARWAYVATNNLELSVNSGEIVQVLTKSGASWLVQARGKKGLVPKEYLVPIAANVFSLTKVGEAPITV
ncbi:hypothetical protein GHT06_017391 [Daphnia sinensis]|uniref:Uncharacterized protein n=1 Tax=Daphnia sinensis TaxID=1820382 RepID=A0AAD5PTT2_9CRUS|nr:hypothetical protein GHT06_017391 [Daphnia sinensis]